MNLSIPYNGDLNFLKLLLKQNKYPVKTVYGKLFQDIVGGGRARYDIADYKEDNLENAIKLTHELGAEFNYLFNGPCSANAEFEKEKEIIKLVDNLLSNYKIDMVTVANPYLLKSLKKHFSKLKFSISVISRVDSLEKVLEYEDAGADEITLDYNIYRNFSELERIRKKSTIGFQLIVNDGYLFNCPWAIYHFQLEGHDSQTGYNNLLKYFSFCRFNCKQKAAKDSWELIKGMWIRPEDLHYYQELGYTKFKIIDRLKETNWLINVIDAYFNRKAGKNLSDILCSFDTFEKDIVETPLIDKDIINYNNIQNLKGYWDLKPFIDNEKLTEKKFLDFFVENKIDCRTLKCSECMYCEKVAVDTVFVDKKNAANVVANLDIVKEKMIDIMKYHDSEVSL